MRANVEIDEALLKEIMVISGMYSPKAAIDRTLRELVKANNRKQILHYKGAAIWDGDLDEMRTSR
jgi:Arc/MetJ family transcription regulator